MSDTTCQWSQTDDQHTPDTWQADCGAMWTFTDGGPKDNDMNFCPKCGKPLSQIDNTMTDKPDPYASEAETRALLVPDTRTAAERKLAQMMTERGADEQGAEDYLILRQIAVEFLAEQPAQYSDIVSDGGMDPRNKFDKPAQQQGLVALDRDGMKKLLEQSGYATACPEEKAAFLSGVRHREAESLDAAPQPAQQEPVAWMYPDDYERMTTSETFCTVYSVEVGSATRGESTVALYTSPPAQRKPLPPSDVVAMWHEARPAHAMNNSFDWYKRGVEDAEAKHGIKEQP